MKTDPFSQARGLTGETLRLPQRLQVQASLRVRRGLLEGEEGELEEGGGEERKAPPPGAARPPLVPRWKTREPAASAVEALDDDDSAME